MKFKSWYWFETPTRREERLRRKVNRMAAKLAALTIELDAATDYARRWDEWRRKVGVA